MQIDLPLIWAGIIAFGVIMYVIMDGFDLGIGILFPFPPYDEDRDVMMNTVAPVWDGNETWLVLGGAGMLGAFPLAYAVLLPAFYLPLLLMLLALIFRGVAFEFRFKSRANRHWWDRAFAWGSICATFAQGVVLGAFIQGIDVSERAFHGGPFVWLNPFALFCGLALVAGYAMLGAGWLIMKTTGDLQAWAYRAMRVLGLLVLGAIAVVSIWTPFIHPAVGARWFSWPNILYLSPVPILVALAGLRLHIALERGEEYTPFLLTLGLFLLSYAGLAISLWPYVIPPSITIWDAASPPASQGFLLVGTIILVPIILSYTVYNYWVFRGKVTAESGYH
ncbi:cytochrome d ubiquinol oxidase subunit II [Benzoatithermus flavus]|uniref:Cytochrome d ubiquinol oxidase subunit II n=1 Tax=Benzoatithermus flavus TaxID=3108223 RepID=A0ABU8XW37_9PROT